MSDVLFTKMFVELSVLCCIHIGAAAVGARDDFLIIHKNWIAFEIQRQCD